MYNISSEIFQAKTNKLYDKSFDDRLLQKIYPDKLA